MILIVSNDPARATELVLTTDIRNYCTGIRTRFRQFAYQTRDYATILAVIAAGSGCMVLNIQQEL